MYSEGHLLLLLLLFYFRFVKHLRSKHRLFFTLNLVELQRNVRWVGHVVCIGEKRNVYRVLVGKPEGKRLPERRRCRWKNVLNWIMRR
jgi:hypothetical protein